MTMRSKSWGVHKYIEGCFSNVFVSGVDAFCASQAFFDCVIAAEEIQEEATIYYGRAIDLT